MENELKESEKNKNKKKKLAKILKCLFLRNGMKLIPDLQVFFPTP